MNMWKSVFGAIALLGLVTSVNAKAAIVDLTDNTFTSITHESFVQGAIGPPIAFEETVGGVVFSFARISGQFRQVATWGDGTTNLSGPFVADIGGGAGSVSAFTLSVSQAVSLNSFIGFAQQFNTNPIFDVTGGSVSSIGNTFSVAGFPGSAIPAVDDFVGGPLALEAGTVYTFDITNSGPATRGYITGLDFTAETTTVPVPAALPLLLTGLAALGLLSRRRG